MDAEHSKYRRVSLPYRKKDLMVSIAKISSHFSLAYGTTVSHTCGQSTVRAFMFMMYSQLEKLSLKVDSDWLRFRIDSTFVWSASVSSRNSAMAGSRKPRPCGASGYAPERERRKSEPWETRRRGVR